MTTRRLRHSANTFAFVTAFAATLGSCGDPPTDGGTPTPGTLRVMLSSPNASDAAIVVRILGVGIQDPLVSGEGRTAYVRVVASGHVQVVIFGPVSSGELLRFDVPDTKQGSSYAVTVLDVSSADNTLRETPTAYTLQVLR